MRLTTLIPTLALCSWLAVPAFAQSVPEVKLPPSPPGQAAIQVAGTWTKTQDGGQRYEGGKWIVVDYSRPTLKGRTAIFGSGTEYGKAVSDGEPVWRAGANATTTLTTQVPIVVGGKTLPPGVYNVFVELKPGAWALVLTNQPRQPKYDRNDKVNLYGSYNYDPNFDVARVAMHMDNVDQKLEEFTITFLTVTDRSWLLALAWENTIACAPIELTK